MDPEKRIPQATDTVAAIRGLTFHNSCFDRTVFGSVDPNFLAAGLSKPAAARESAPPSESGHP